jgi:hypothetical protein
LKALLRPINLARLQRCVNTCSLQLPVYAVRFHRQRQLQLLPPAATITMITTTHLHLRAHYYIYAITITTPPSPQPPLSLPFHQQPPPRVLLTASSITLHAAPQVSSSVPSNLVELATLDEKSMVDAIKQRYAADQVGT